MSKQHEVTAQDIQAAIINLPNRPPVMLGHALAEMYGVSTKQLSQAVRRNLDRFPEDFTFRVTEEEMPYLQNEGLTLQSGGHFPRVFTRNGANQLATVLKSDIAAERSVQIIRAFSAFEEMFQVNSEGRPALYTMVKTVDLLMLQQYYVEGRGKMCALPLSAEEAEGMKRDILSGMKTAQVAKKYNRAKSTVKKHTKVERARIVLEKSGQMALPFQG